MLNLLLTFSFFAHLVDIHLPSAEEERMIQQIQEEKENQTNQEIAQDPDSSEEERLEALIKLIEAGKLGGSWNPK